MPGSPRKKRRGVFPIEATGTQRARPTKRGKARHYKCDARGGDFRLKPNDEIWRAPGLKPRPPKEKTRRSAGLPTWPGHAGADSQKWLSHCYTELFVAEGD